MKTTLLLLALCAGLHAQTKDPIVDVESGTHENWKITGDGVIAIESPDGERMAISERFITPNSDWTPSKISCVWGDRYVAVFAQHPRLTEILVFDTKTQKKLTQTFSSKMPAWYEECRVIKDRPVEGWQKNTLLIETIGFPAQGPPQRMKQILKVENGSFSTSPAAPAQKGVSAPAQMPGDAPQKPKPLPAEPPRSIEFGSP